MADSEIHVPLFAAKAPLGLIDRASWLVALCEGKRVLHVGCADHPLTRERMSSPDFLHRQVTDAASSCVGIDVSEEAIAALRAAGYDNVEQVDAERLSDRFGAEFDLIVAGEVLEHLPRPGLFVAEAGKVLRSGGRLAVTVPNAFNLMRLLQLLRGREMVHRDHFYYFSSKTLARLVGSFGFSLDELGYTDPLQFARYRPGLTEIWRFLLERQPVLGQSVVASFVAGKVDTPHRVVD